MRLATASALASPTGASRPEATRNAARQAPLPELIFRPPGQSGKALGMTLGYALLSISHYE
ncbi:hypothetical protein ABIB60_003926 [Hymenobacter sp. UYP22]